MKKFYLSIVSLMLCTMMQAISWTKPQFTTTTNPTTGGSTLYYLYHVGQQQLLTAGAKWGTHAVLDSTGVNALPYEIFYSYEIGYQFHSPNADNQGYLFRDDTGTGVYTDYNGHSNVSLRWEIIQNGNGTVSLRTAADDPVWGNGGTKVWWEEYKYLLGWNPLAEDKTKEGQSMGTNQSVYMLYPDVENYQYEWAFVAESEYNLYSAKLALYATAEQAEKKGINYLTYNATYNGSDINAIKAATDELKAKIEQSEQEEEEEDNEIGEAVFFKMIDGSSIIFPTKYIEDRKEDGQFITFSLRGDTTVSLKKTRIVSETSEYQGELPEFESYKFNNKFNDQLFTDAEGVIDNVNHKVNVAVGCIGKRLTPSFKLPDDVKAYVNGKRQYSKQTRLRFDKPVHYTLAYPEQYVYKVKKTKDEVWSIPESEDEWISTKVDLTGDMFSTNAPSNQGEDPKNMLDGNHNTIYHSTWGSGAYTPLTWYDGAYYGDGVSQWPYLQIELPETMENLKFEYITRSGNNNYAPLGLILQGSTNGTSWVNVKTFTADDDNLPITTDAIYTSPVIAWNTSYKYMRLQLTASQRKNYLVFSEFALYNVAENPDYQTSDPVLVSPAEYKKGFEPYGTDYEVTVDFLTEHATTEYKVPRVDIWFGDSTTWNSSMWIGRYGKTYYEDAQIKIDGGGVYPDLEKMVVQVKGRGNSTWDDSYSSKNPYRLKFEEKQKPLGMKKGKSWVLLCNKQTGSMTTNALAMKVADMVETRGCNHIVPVELYVNNQYRGSYNFTEKTGFSNNSIDIADETNAVMIELDTYNDETIYTEANYGIKTKIKEPDLEDASTVTDLTSSQIMSAFNALTYDVKNDCENAMFNVESVVSAMFVTDLVRNEELMHAKSWFLYNENILAEDSLWHLGPVWDFDWSFGYENSHNYFISAADVDLFYYMPNKSSNKGYPFFRDLLRSSEKVKKEYYRLWYHFMNDGRMDELIEYCDDYYQYASESFVHNYSKWSDGRNYATHTTNAKSWLKKRAEYIFSQLEVYDLSDDIIEPEDDYGQPDRIDVAELAQRAVNVYNLNGMLIRRQVPYSRFADGLQPGIYIVNGRKIAVGR